MGDLPRERKRAGWGKQWAGTLESHRHMCVIKQINNIILPNFKTSPCSQLCN